MIRPPVMNETGRDSESQLYELTLFEPVLLKQTFFQLALSVWICLYPSPLPDPDTLQLYHRLVSVSTFLLKYFLSNIGYTNLP